MSSLTKVSRAALYASDEDILSEEYQPDLEFEIVELNKEIPDTNEPEGVEEEEEFDFPLFSFGSTDNKEKPKEEEERGRPKHVMKVTLRERSEERIVNERPSTYYFANYTEQERLEFQQVAVTADDIIHQASLSSSRDPFLHRVLNLNEYNHQIDLERKPRKRPGKKQRLGKIEAKTNIKAKNKKIKEMQQEEERRILKKKLHKRGGKKNKKKNQAATAVPTTS